MARLIKRIANVNKSIGDFVDDLLSAQEDGVDVDEYLCPKSNIYFDVAEDLGLFVFTGDCASDLIDVLAARYGKSKKEARKLAIDALANYFDDDTYYAEQIIDNKSGDIAMCYVFDTVNLEMNTCDDDTIEVVLERVIDEMLQGRTSKLLDDLERDFYQKHPEYE